MSPTTDRSLAAATALFRRWRSTRERGERIPLDLWTAAAAAARDHGVSRTSAALGLDYYSLKRRVEGIPRMPRARQSPTPQPSSPTGPTFVEIPVAAATTAGTVACTIVLEHSRTDSSTASLRIELPAIASSELAALVERWGPRS
jgi:hypothetical protein